MNDISKSKKCDVGIDSVSVEFIILLLITPFFSRLLNMTLLSSKDDDADNNVSFLLSSLSSDLGYKSLLNLLDENWDLFKTRWDNLK